MGSSGIPTEPDLPSEESRLFSLKNWNNRYIGENACAIVDGVVCEI